MRCPMQCATSEKNSLIAPPRPEKRLKSRPCPQTGRRCHSHAGRMPPTARGGRRRRWILAAGVGYAPIHRTLTPVHARPHTSAPSTRNIDTAPESSGIPFPSPGAASRWRRTARGGCTSPASSRVSHPRPRGNRQRRRNVSRTMSRRRRRTSTMSMTSPTTLPPRPGPHPRASTPSHRRHHPSGRRRRCSKPPSPPHRPPRLPPPSTRHPRERQPRAIGETDSPRDQKEPTQPRDRSWTTT